MRLGAQLLPGASFFAGAVQGGEVALAGAVAGA
jgi:hypothetical protein